MCITLESRFIELFGSNPKEVPYEQRRKNWEEWKRIAKEQNSIEALNWWTKDNLDVCGACIYKSGDWCKWAELPCNYNPVTQIIGMACMGIGKEENSQLEMDL